MKFKKIFFVEDVLTDHELALGIHGAFSTSESTSTYMDDIKPKELKGYPVVIYDKKPHLATVYLLDKKGKTLKLKIEQEIKLTEKTLEKMLDLKEIEERKIVLKGIKWPDRIEEYDKYPHRQVEGQIEEAIQDIYGKELKKRRALPISDFDWSVRVKGYLEKSGIKTIGELTKYTEEKLLSTGILGRYSIVEIQDTLERLGLKLSG